MGSPHRTVEAIVEIDLADGHYAYGRILANADFGFYDLYTTERVQDLEQIITRPLLFIVAVNTGAVNAGRWVKIGKRPLPAALQQLPLKFIQDPLALDKFELYEPLTGRITPALKEQCAGLERCAVWDPSHVEERLRDHYAGRPNRYRAQDVALFD
ncbi:immunity 26/phosphotriesterase HocA family protein [Hymenobacter crusticola]|uniref:Uncharacterized protein n=1 Tax=Hymenobacter crusticola TaxID=1770526 RepID=A0A243W651_9BACT|nr:immunity 26/phosphotriesterase HocA family protein [Hymenobacter crusticola]OUJ69797.1 hypothetical protein BXP70_26170 [Hymenobacter crusticola]